MCGPLPRFSKFSALLRLVWIQRYLTTGWSIQEDPPESGIEVVTAPQPVDKLLQAFVMETQQPCRKLAYLPHTSVSGSTFVVHDRQVPAFTYLPHDVLYRGEHWHGNGKVQSASASYRIGT